ncbi:hypothetical protein C8F04DRAFT_1262017 [Mycena alexandri]|uniref:Protein kinase domain-containing protein n=1 Tax=Mycena alexandri TaxID=1745969 RepID=A0AAD6SRD6_9AGAR|nr:hypothetical protein C8F04DRAFT_1262017 [Mycena alexandri]
METLPPIKSQLMPFGSLWFSPPQNWPWEQREAKVQFDPLWLWHPHPPSVYTHRHAPTLRTDPPPWQLQALVRDPDRISDTIGLKLQGAHIDKESRDAVQSLSLRISAQPTLVESEVIGAGGFSAVYKGRWKEKWSVVIKEFINDEDIDDVMDEIWIWRRMEHPNLLPFIGGALIQPPYFTVLPYFAHGNVLQYIPATTMWIVCKWRV